MLLGSLKVATAGMPRPSQWKMARFDDTPSRSVELGHLPPRGQHHGRPRPTTAPAHKRAWTP